MDAPGFKTILCPVDFSGLSAYALQHASVLAGCGQAKIIAAYANWFEAPAYFTAGRLEELQKSFRDSLGEAESALKSFVAETLGESGGNVETRVVEALPADGIRDLAASTGAGLIVMGTHGRTGLNRWTLGSVAERVLRESPFPLLTVRSAPRGPIRRILCPIDGTEASRNAFLLAARLGACFSAEITALYVHDGGSVRPVPDLCHWIPDETRQHCNIRELTRHGTPAGEIVALASDGAFDLLVIGAPQRRFFKGHVMGTTTLRAVRHALCPVLRMIGPAEFHCQSFSSSQ